MQEKEYKKDGETSGSDEDRVHRPDRKRVPSESRMRVGSARQ